MSEYVLNRNPDGDDVLHRNAGEQCNLDDSEGRQKVDAETAEALLLRGDALLCGHCRSDG